MTRRSHALRNGFTLLEVLVALAILALSAAAVLRQTQLGVRHQQQLELKSAALWIADDTLASLSLSSNFLPVGRAVRTVSLQGRDWDVTTDISATPDENLRRVVVSVALAGSADDSSLVSFTTYRGRY
jgi:general secretion pathway protein I